MSRLSDYTVASHLAQTDALRREVFQDLRLRILRMCPEVTETPVKILIGYRVTQNFAEIHFGRSKLKVHLRPIMYDDPKGIVQTLVNPGFVMDRRFYLSEPTGVPYALTLIEQSYRSTI